MFWTLKKIEVTQNIEHTLIQYPNFKQLVSEKALYPLLKNTRVWNKVKSLKSRDSQNTKVLL